METETVNVSTTYTAQQFFHLLDRLDGASQKTLNIHPEVWEEVAISSETVKLSNHITQETLTVSVEAGDGAGWFVVAVWRLLAVSQDDFDGSYTDKLLFGFSQHDGDWGDAEDALAGWYHVMQAKLAGEAV